VFAVRGARSVYAIGKLKIWSGSISSASAVEKRKIYFGQAVFFLRWELGQCDAALLQTRLYVLRWCQQSLVLIVQGNQQKKGHPLSLYLRDQKISKEQKRKRIREKRESYYIAFCLYFAGGKAYTHSCFLLWKGRRRRHLALHFTLIFVVASLVSSLL
jgi:hypothetical protein